MTLRLAFDSARDDWWQRYWDESVRNGLRAANPDMVEFICSEMRQRTVKLSQRLAISAEGSAGHEAEWTAAIAACQRAFDEHFRNVMLEMIELLALLWIERQRSNGTGEAC